MSGLHLRLDEEDKSYHPHGHAYSEHTIRTKEGERKVCWYCEKPRGSHKREVRIVDGQRVVRSL